MRTMRLWLASASACVTLLSGCAVGPNFERPANPPVERYTEDATPMQIGATTDADAQRLVFGEATSPDWWRLFRSPELDQLVERALTNNRSLAAASHSLAEASELARAEGADLYPDVDLTAGVGRQKLGAQFLGTFPKPPPFTYYAIGTRVSYSLDYTGGVGRSIEQQRALAEYRQHQLEAARLAVSGNAVLKALEIASLNAQIETLESVLERDRENLDLVQKAFDAGSVSRLDIVSAQSQLASDTTSLAPLRQRLAAARHALAVIVGSTPASSGLQSFDLSTFALPTEVPVAVPSELAHRRPDILSAESQLHAATAAVGVATANLYPHIDLTGTFGPQAISTGALFDSASSAWSLAGGLVAPLFDGGRLRAEKRATVEALQASAANYDQTVLEAFQQVADALDALTQGADALRAQTAAEAAARNNVELTRESYDAGQIGVLQVLDAERSYQQARLGFVKAQAQRYIDTVQLLLALGGTEPTT